MEELSLSPRTYSRTTVAETAAWRAPSAVRFDGRPANDAFHAGGAPVEMEPVPRWLVVVGGGFVAAILGALLGGALSV
jgi:hypothetical protein